MSERVAERAASGSPYRYAERAPSAGIAPWVLSLWSFRVGPGADAPDPYTVFPDGCTSIAVARQPHVPPMLVFAGPSVRATQPPVSSGMRLVGFRLWPDTTELVTGVPARMLRDRLGPPPLRIGEQFASLLPAVSATEDEDSGFAAIDRALVECIRGLAAPDARIREAVRAIVAARGEVRMDAVARRAGIGLRHLQRRFPLATGLTLREYARVRRLREALAHQLEPVAPGWSRIAAERGFVDHAHLTREFVALTGLPPTVAARQMRRTEHDDVKP